MVLVICKRHGKREGERKQKRMIMKVEAKWDYTKLTGHVGQNRSSSK